MKTSIIINTGEDLLKTPEKNKNNNSKFSSIINNRSSTTNESGSAFSSQFNTMATSSNKTLSIPKKPIHKSKSNGRFNSKKGFNGLILPDEILNSIENNLFLPPINSNKQQNTIIDKADEIVKERKKRYLGRSLRPTKSTILEKSKEICLNNFIISQIREKRNIINDKQALIFTKLRETEKNFELDYKNFIDFVEKINKKDKEEEQHLNNLKNESKNIELKLLDEMSLNKSLEMRIESIIKQIVLLQSYGSFLHKVFYKPFIYDELKKINLKRKKYLSITETIISLYEKSQSDEIFENDSQEIVSDVELLMDKFIYFENQVLSIIKDKEDLEEEIVDIKKNYKNILEHLIERRDDLQNEYTKLKQEKREVSNMMSNFNKIDVNSGDSDQYLEYIIELGKEIGLDMKKTKNHKNSQMLKTSKICKEIIDLLCQKEILANTNISIIEYILNNGDEKEKETIEYYINETKKSSKKEKQEILRELQENKEKIKTLKAIQKSRKIIFRGRKVFPDIPILKNKNKNKKFIEKQNKEEENFEYLNYSSEED